ncbi:Yae1 family protein [Bacillus sp. E(2018)]|uniref:Yae1 family protein n=1 Tax=Bacillus sp. E(2018) TaxID=2502239 RepID=UPI0010F5A955|nr:Yae1 family protein [Bacillus sp. E(2018)]
MLLFLVFLETGCSDKAINAAFEEGKQEGYDEGYEMGYDEGLEENKGSGHEEGYNEGFEKGKEEGFELGHEEGYAVAIEEMESNEYIPNINDSELGIGDLTLLSDGLDWSIALDIDKRDFIQRISNLSYSNSKQAVAMLDAYYESHSKIKTIQEALDDLKSR